jgi:hypothetical protein
MSKRPLSNERCDHCNASPPTARPSFGEIAIGTVFCILIATALMVAACAAYRVMEQTPHGLFSDPVWREPLNSWSL